MSQNNNFACHLACIQQPVKALAGSRRIGMKTTRPGVE